MDDDDGVGFDCVFGYGVYCGVFLFEDVGGFFEYCCIEVSGFYDGVFGSE